MKEEEGRVDGGGVGKEEGGGGGGVPNLVYVGMSCTVVALPDGVRGLAK